MNGNRFPGLPRWGITVLRVVVGIVFVMHGGQKLFIFGFSGVAAFMSQMGIPEPMVAAVIVTLVEFFGGIAHVLGLFSRWAAIPLAIDMLVAILVVNLPAGFFLPMGFEFTLTLLAANIALALAGPGEASLEVLLMRREA